jgi:glycosyltransferase involved in cell wall biosynthesis
MKILMLIDSLVKGGRERRLIELLKGFSKYSDVELGLVLFSKKIEYPEIHQLEVPIYYLERKPKKDPRVFWRLFKICKKEQPDIIHSWGTMPSIYAIPAVKLLGIKFINASIANAPDNLSWRDSDLLRSKLTYPFCDAVVGNSQAGLSVYEAPVNKSFCFYNGFDFQRIGHLEEETNVRKKYEIPDGLITGMVGGFFDRKDYQTYIQSAIQYLNKRKDMTFLAIGDGPNLDQVKAMVPERHRDRILFTGMVHDVESLVNIFDIGVLATYTEGISNSIMEYMVLGKPVIASDGGGTKELVIDKETGFLIPQRDPERLYECLKLLASNQALRVKYGANGKLRIHTHFTLARMKKDYYDLYQKLVKDETLHSQTKASKLSGATNK